MVLRNLNVSVFSAESWEIGVRMPGKGWKMLVFLQV